MATIKDIAREAGVSHGTVSNVLNKTGKVSVEKIRLVEQAAKKLGYIPNTQAQLLRQGSPSHVALIIPSLKEESYLDLYSSLQTILKEEGYAVTVYITDDIEENELSLLKQIPHSNLLAIVTISSLRKGAFASSLYGTAPCPVIYVDRRPDMMRPLDSYISFDDTVISTSLADYIAGKGYSRIAFFSSPGSIPDSTKIYEAVLSQLPQGTSMLRFSSDINLVLSKAFDIILADEKIEAVFTSGMLRADAILNAIALSCMEEPPQVIALSPLSRIPDQHLEIYELDYSKIGMEAAQLLLKQETGRKEAATKLIAPNGFPFKFPSIQKTSAETLSLLTISSPSADALKKLSPMLEDAAGIKLKIISMPYQDLHQQIPMMSQKLHYDLIRMDIAQLDDLGQAAYLPLSKAGIFPSLFIPDPVYNLRSQSFTGIHSDYALPFDPSTQIFLYRKDLFQNATICRSFYEKYHQKLAVPANFADYMRIAEFFTREYNPLSPTKYGATMTYGTATAAACDFLPYLLSATEKSKEDYISRDILIKAIQQYLRMRNYCSQQSWWMDSLTQFMNHEAATTIIFSNYASYAINSKHSGVVGKIGAAIVPGRHPLIGGGVIGICKYSHKLTACRQFFNWYYSRDICSLLVKLGATSPLTVSYSDVKNLEVFPWMSTAKENFELATRGIYKNPNYSISQFEFTLGTAMRNLITEIMSLDEALEFIFPAIKK